MIDLCRSSRKLEKFTDNPGPGSYNYPQSSTQAPSFSTSVRSVSTYSSQYFEDIPGPGAYRTPSSLVRKHLSPFNSTQARFSDPPNIWNPGPGAYNIANEVKRRKEITPSNRMKIHPEAVPSSIPQLGRHEIAEFDGISKRTGPSDYSPTYKQVKPNPSFAVFGQSGRELWDKHNSHTKINSRHHVGPGLYLSEEVLNPQAYMSKSPRFQTVKNKGPGPGAYESIDLLSTKGIALPKAERKLDLPRGEGQERKSKLSLSLDEATSSGTLPFKSKAHRWHIRSDPMVGPGSYDIDSASETPSHVFSSSKRFVYDSKDNQPGPGSYQFPFTKQERAAFVNSTDQRFGKDSHFGSNKNPEPGRYGRLAKWGTNSFNLYQMYGVESGRTHQHSKSDGPGPSKYNNRLAPKNAASKFGMDSRFKGNNSKGSLGPGAYETVQSLIKKSYNITWMNN